MTIAEQITRAKTDYDEVYEAGKQKQYDEFWDAYQYNGKRTDYLQAFSGKGWNNTTFNPKYSIEPSTSYNMFRNFGEWSLKLDLVDKLNKCGITLDFSKCTNFTQTFAFAAFTKIGIININNSVTDISNMVYGSYIQTIEKLICHENLKYTNTFISCNYLEDITIEGIIGKNISFQNSPLSVESMKSVIGCLKNYSGTDEEAVYTVKFSTTCWEELNLNCEPPEGFIYEDGWQYYVNSLGWNI